MMKKNNVIFRIALIAIAIVCFSASNSFAGIGDGLNDKEKRNLFRTLRVIQEDIKSFRFRLRDLENKKLQNLQLNQAEILAQIDKIKRMIPALNGALEQTKSDLIQQTLGLGAKLAEIQVALTKKIENINNAVSAFQLQTQTQAKNQGYLLEKSRIEFLAELNQLKQGFKTDMETFAKLNKQFSHDLTQSSSAAQARVIAELSQLRQGVKADMETFARQNEATLDRFAKGSSESLKNNLGKMAAHINEQNKKIAGTNALLKDELIPTIVAQNQKTLNTLSQSQEKNMRIHGENHGALTQGIAKIDALNRKMVEILKKSARENAVANGKINLLDEDIRKVNKNVIDGIGGLGNNLDRKLDLLVKEQSAASASIVSLQTELARLQGATAQSEKTLAGRSDSLNQKMGQVLATITQGEETSRVVDERVAKMIDVLQISAAQGNLIEEKLDQSILKIEEGQSHAALANEKMGKLIEILKKIVTAQSKLDTIVKNEAKIKEALNDLRRKANVNISRTDDIKKQLKRMVRPSSK